MSVKLRSIRVYIFDSTPDHCLTLKWDQTSDCIAVTESHVDLVKAILYFLSHVLGCLYMFASSIQC